MKEKLKTVIVDSVLCVAALSNGRESFFSPSWLGLLITVTEVKVQGPP